MFDKDRFIEDCRAAAKETQPGLAVKELIARAVSDPREVARASVSRKRAWSTFSTAEMTSIFSTSPGRLS